MSSIPIDAKLSQEEVDHILATIENAQRNLLSIPRPLAEADSSQEATHNEDGLSIAPLGSVDSASILSNLEADIKSIEDALSFLIKLGHEQRQSMRKLNEEDRAFMDAMAEQIREHPEMVPPGINAETFFAHLDLMKKLETIQPAFEQLYQLLDALAYPIQGMDRTQ